VQCGGRIEQSAIAATPGEGGFRFEAARRGPPQGFVGLSMLERSVQASWTSRFSDQVYLYEARGGLWSYPFRYPTRNLVSVALDPPRESIPTGG
jgi:hypothetical protein